MKKKRVSVSWSGGKDSAFALHKIMQSRIYEVVNLHTVIDEETKRVGLHGVREDLIVKQAQTLGLPLVELYLPKSSDHVAYEKLIRAFYNQCVRENIDGIVFGDLFLEDIRDYRVKLLSDLKCLPIFPLWGIDTSIIFDEFIRAGFKTVICSANADLFSPDQVGRVLDLSFPLTLKPGVDVCGENGEFHTLVYDGPIFNQPLFFEKGEMVKKTYAFTRKNRSGDEEKVESSFWFQDYILPKMVNERWLPRSAEK